MQLTCYRTSVLAALACVSIAGVANAATSSRSEKPHTAQGFPSTFVSACRVTGHPKELRYASDLNSLSGVTAKGAILGYVIDIGKGGPPSENSSDGKKSYEAFNLFVVNPIESGDLPNGTSQPGLGKSMKTGPATTLYRASDKTLWSIEWRASVTFEDDLEPGGSMEGQGGLLSDAEYGDIIAYLQTQPFQLVSDWKSILSNAGTLPVCKIKWIETDRYLRSMSN